MMIDHFYTLIFFISLFVFVEIVRLFLFFRKNNFSLDTQEEASVLKENLEQTRNLVRVLCHDLSNHLTVIVGTSNRARKKKNLTPEQNAQMWDRTHRAAMMQKELIDHVRFLERVQGGKMQLPLSSVSLLELFDKIVFLFENSLNEKGINLKINWENDDSLLKVFAEPVSLLNNVLSNIISNAIKFSNEGSSIFVDIKRKDSNVHIVIKDQGIGMPESIIADLFHIDRPTSRSGTKGESGSGFGMPLVLAYMKRYGGAVEVTSKDIDSFPDDHGTTITLIFNKSNEIIHPKLGAA